MRKKFFLLLCMLAYMYSGFAQSVFKPKKQVSAISTISASNPNSGNVATAPAASQPANNDAVKGPTNAGDPMAVNGHFEIARPNAHGLTEHINVNYDLGLKPFVDVIHLNLFTPDPTMFTVHVTDAATGRVVMVWTPTAISHNYAEDLNIARLSRGAYQLKIFAGHFETLLHTVAFTKE